MSESEMWAQTRPLIECLDPVRIESPITAGCPDVNHIHGWIELKYMSKWPVRPDTPLRVGHFVPEQRVWITRREARGGRVHVFLKVGTDWLLFRGVDAAKYLGHVSKSELYALAIATWAHLPDKRELVSLLSPDQ